MWVIKDLAFILIAGTLSGTVLAKPANPAEPASKSSVSTSTSNSTPVHRPYKPKSIASMFSPQAKLAEETKLTAAALAGTGADDKLVDTMVPEGAKLVDGTQQNEFYIVPKDGAIPTLETAQTIAVTKAMDEATEMVNKIDVPKLEAALDEKVHTPGAAPESVKTMKNKLGPNVKMMAENTVKSPIQLVDATPVSDATPPPAETAPVELSSAATETSTDNRTTRTAQTAQPEKKKVHHNSKAKHQHAAKTKKVKFKSHHQVKTKEKAKIHETKITAKMKTKSKTILSKHHPKKQSKHPSTKTKHSVVYHGKTYKVKNFADLH